MPGPPAKSPFTTEFLGKNNSIASKFDKWALELKSDPDKLFLLNGLAHGFRVSDIDATSHVRQAECNNHPSSLKYADLVEKDLKCQLSLGYYVFASSRPSIVSPLGAIKKDDCDEVRIIHDASRPVGDAMNDYSTLYTVRYQTLQEACNLAKPGYFLAKVDLKQAYRSVPISPMDYCLTGLKWRFKGDSKSSYLIDTRLSFGARLAPGCFHRVTQAVRRMMARRGFYNLVVYLDDFLVVEETEQRCHEAQLTLISLLIELGFLISWKKVLGPCKALPFLGIVIDTMSCSLYLQEHKVAKLYESLQEFSARKRASKRQLQRLAGQLNWACQAVMGGRFFLRRILDAVNSLKQSYHKCKLTAAFKLDVKWWLSFLDRFNGKVYYRVCDTFVVGTDSSKGGAGMFCRGDWQYVHWKKDFPAFYHLHINHKEVLAILLAAERWAPLWQGADITVITDSVVAKAVINKGTCKNPLVMESLRNLFWLQVKYNFRLKAIHIPGSLNDLPDAISRLHEPGQILRLKSLLDNWHRHSQYHAHIDWASHMSCYAFQVVLPRLRQWHSRLSWKLN